MRLVHTWTQQFAPLSSTELETETVSRCGSVHRVRRTPIVVRRTVRGAHHLVLLLYGAITHIG
jgi:hypothetical protein